MDQLTVVIIYQQSMNREIPVANRVIHRKELQRANDFHLNKINSMKFSNLSALNSKHQGAHKVKADLTRLLPLENRNRRVRTVMNEERIREENKNIYNRLVNQKPTLSSKLFAEERSKNLEFLRRIGRYPYRPNSTVVLDPLQEDRQGGQLQRSHTFDDIDEPSELCSNIKISLNSMESMKYYHINSKIQQEQKKQHTIVLWSKVVQLNKQWHSVKFSRFKNHYQIDVSPYPDHNIEYSIKLAEQVGTAMLSQNDYDYEFITVKFIKFTHQTLCLSFQLKNDKKKHFYKFLKKSPNNQDSTFPPSPTGKNKHNPITFPPQSPPVRKTVFAIQNEEKQVKQTKTRPRILTQQIQESNLQSAYDQLGHDIEIDLSRR